MDVCAHLCVCCAHQRQKVAILPKFLNLKILHDSIDQFIVWRVEDDDLEIQYMSKI